ncbi:MAG: response regulator [Candidatus Handelsmanbacteria bacterium]|nr:response regulator [Candidatus Handelsmanbacteria bacterium]
MPNFKLLFVDDEADFVSTIEEFFTGQGYTVFTAANGQQGLLRLKEHLPDAVFLDISMPHMDGRETLRVIRHLDPRIKVIIVSGYASEALACELLDGGAYDFFQKPIDLMQLQQTIERLALLKELADP